jgi:Tfp pilus assembly protein PilE
MTPQPPAAGPEKKKSTGMIILLVLLGVGGCCVVGGGILAAIAIPNFVRYKARAQQSEAKVLLKSIYTYERAFNAEKSAFTENGDEAGMSLDANRYVCVLGRDGKVLGRAANAEDLAAALRSRVPQLGVSGKCPNCEFTAACAGNIDGDPELDIWTISSAPRTMGGEEVPPGSPYNDFSDITDAPGGRM